MGSKDLLTLVCRYLDCVWFSIHVSSFFSEFRQLAVWQNRQQAVSLQGHYVTTKRCFGYFSYLFSSTTFLILSKPSHTSVNEIYNGAKPRRILSGSRKSGITFISSIRARLMRYPSSWRILICEPRLAESRGEPRVKPNGASRLSVR